MANDPEEKRDTSNNDMEVDGQNMGYDTDEEGGLRVDEEIYIPPPPRVFSEVDTTGPRLMISKIVNENFKSYAGTQVIGPFHKVNIICYLKTKDFLIRLKTVLFFRAFQQ